MKIFIQKWGKTIIISLFLICACIVGNLPGYTSKVQVLGASVHVAPVHTLTPIPTPVPITIINNIIVPTSSPIVVTQVPIPTLAPIPTSQIIIVTPTPAPTPFLEPTPTATPTVSPAPTSTTQTIEVDIDYSGEHIASTYTTTITVGENAWQAVQSAVGLANIHYTDYGGSLGIFITGFNGVDASSNQYFDFQVNGVSSNVGVSSYVVNNHDILKFVLKSF